LADPLDRVVETLLVALGYQAEPPLPLERIAQSLGVDEVRCVPLLEEGRLERSSTGTRILLNSEAPPPRQRFTLAHELGHLVLADPGQPLVARRAGTFTSEERFCDSFAAALLIPARWLERNYRTRPASLAAAREIAGHCESSLAATVVRGNSLLQWNRSFLRWRCDAKGVWRLASWAGVAPGLRGSLVTTPETQIALNEIAPASDGLYALPLGLRGRTGHFSTEVWISPRRKAAVGLVAGLS
jgi:hypothetical protein